MRRRRILLAPLTALSIVPGVWALDVQLGGLSGNRALLLVDGQPPRFLQAGQSVGAVRLLQVTPDSAVVEAEGERLTLRLGQAPLHHQPGTTNGQRVVLQASEGGHFISAGQINGRHVDFLVDTGATVVVLSRADADRIGLKLDNTQRVQMSTANGTVVGHRVRLTSVKLGDTTLGDVSAVVLPSAMPYVLLGNSFLSRFQLKRENATLILEKRF